MLRCAVLCCAVLCCRAAAPSLLGLSVGFRDEPRGWRGALPGHGRIGVLALQYNNYLTLPTQVPYLELELKLELGMLARVLLVRSHGQKTP